MAGAGEDICLANVDGKYYAIGQVCTHEGGPLPEILLLGDPLSSIWETVYSEK